MKKEKKIDFPVRVRVVLNFTVSCRFIAGLSSPRPTGHMRPAKQYCVAREVILAELMK